MTEAPPPDSSDAQLIGELRKLAESAARIGGNLAYESFGTSQPVRLKDDRSEVTDVDLAAEHAIITHIRAQRPSDTFIGEETSLEPHASRRGDPVSDVNPQAPIANRQAICWIIDPIDGTRNYIRDIPIFVCSVAAMRGGQPIAGAIYDPVQNLMYSAAQGRGTSVDGGQVTADSARFEKLYGPKAKLLVGIPSARHPAIQRFVLDAVRRHVVRNFGSAALHLALAACGRLDIAVLGSGRLWDVAAGCLLITEAGGVATAPNGAPLFPIDVSRYAGEEVPLLAGRPDAHARLMREASDA